MSNGSARDSLFLAFFTSAKVITTVSMTTATVLKPWQVDPTKWIIWTLSKLRLTRDLRRVPKEKIKSAEQENRELASSKIDA